MELQHDIIQSKKAAKVYLALTFGVCFLLGILAFLSAPQQRESIFLFLRTFFTPLPLLAALVTRRLLKDRSPLNISLRVWRNKKMLAFSALLPGIAVLLGAAIYYAIYPQELIPNIQALFNFCVKYGLPSSISVNAGTIALTMVILWLASIFAIPIHVLELGEEVGWRGYFLPKLLSFMSVKKAVLTNGILWGIMHAPLIFFGFNYGSNCWGAPITGILLMTVFCVCLGILMSYTMIKTNNCMYAAIIHGAINVTADLQILSVAVNKPLLGPSPTGIIGMSVIVLISIFVFFKKLR